MIEQDEQPRNKPYFLCEYAHAMGNAIGNLENTGIILSIIRNV